MKKVLICDYTLRKLAQERQLALLFREKTAIASAIDAYGADVIELPLIKNVKEDTVINKTLAMMTKRAVLAIPAGELPRESFESIKTALHPRLQVEYPVSTVQMEYGYHMKAEKMQEKILNACREALSLCPDVELILEDAGRADRTFLFGLCREAEAMGVGMVTICDASGTMLPAELAELIGAVRAEVQLPVCVKVSDRLHLAAALAVAALSAGAAAVKCAAVGKDALCTSDLSDLIEERGAEIGLSVGLDRTKLHRNITQMMEHVTPDTEAESENGTHDLFLDADCSLDKMAEAVIALGYELTPEDMGKVHAVLKNMAGKKGIIGKKELEAIIANSAMQVPSTYHIESYTVTSSNLAASMAQVTLKKGEDLLSGVAVGDGPIDAAFRALEQILGFHYELDDFQIQAVTEGKEALGQTLVRLRNGGKLYSGTGVSPDIIAASIRAYLNALNKIVYEDGRA